MDKGLVCLIAFVCFCVLVFSNSSHYLRKLRWNFPVKYSSKFEEIITITPQDSLYFEDQNSKQKPDSFEYLNGSSSGLYYKKNSEFFASQQLHWNFHIDDSNSLNNKPYKCLPKSFGYSIEKGNQVFPPHEYPSCNTLNLAGPNIKWDYQTNLFEMECPKGKQGKYLLEPKGLERSIKLQPNMAQHWKVQEYTAPVKLTTEEYVYASCGEENFSKAIYVPRFNQTLYNETLTKMQSLNKGTTPKPQIVFFLTVDSYSRRHFYRKMPQSVEFLSSLKNSSYSVFDFKIHNVIGSNSIKNMFPVFSNLPTTERKDSPEKDLAGKQSMWKLFKNRGYVTLFGLENCDYYFPGAIGQEIDVDHTVRSFYCASNDFLDIRTDKEFLLTQRCVGDYMSHYYLLNYTHAFSELYKGLNQWIYLHINSAHEGTGLHAATLDSDLTWFLQTYLKAFEKTHDVAIFLQADHGMRYGNWFKEIDAYIENKLPVFFLIANNELLNKIEYSYDTLQHNTKLLNTKVDLRKSALYLSELPYGQEYKVNKDPYHHRYVNLFKEKVLYNRTCESARIPGPYCSCLEMLEIPKKHYTDKTTSYGEILFEAAQASVYKVNSEAYTPKSFYPGVVCQHLSFDKIVKAYVTKISNVEEQFLLQFKVKESPKAVFEALVVVGTDERSYLLDNVQKENPRDPLVYRNFKSMMRVLGVNRKDSYGGTCEKVARNLEISGEYCICKDIDYLRENYPSAVPSNL